MELRSKEREHSALSVPRRKLLACLSLLAIGRRVAIGREARLHGLALLSVVDVDVESLQSLRRRWSSRTFQYGYLVTTSLQSLALPSACPSLQLGPRLRA